MYILHIDESQCHFKKITCPNTLNNSHSLSNPQHFYLVLIFFLSSRLILFQSGDSTKTVFYS